MTGNTVVLSTGSNHSWLPEDVLQKQIEQTIAAIKARQPDANIVMVNPVKNFTWGFQPGQSSTTPYDAATGAAQKYGVQTVDFEPGADNIHPADVAALVNRIQGVAGTPSAQWTPIGDSIAEMIAKQTGASSDLTKASMTPQYILDNFASRMPGEAAPAVANRAPANAQEIQKIYADLFGRTAEQGGLDYWQNLAKNQNVDAMGLRDMIGRAGMSDEAKAASQALVDSGQSQYLGGGMEWNPVQRAAMPDQAAYTGGAETSASTGITPASLTVPDAASNLANQSNVQAQQPVGAADIQKIYADLFGRTAEQGGLDYWQNMANTQGLGVADLTNMIGQAGRDASNQAAAQQLVNSGQSQALGGGSIWNPEQQNYACGGRVSPLSSISRFK